MPNHLVGRTVAAAVFAAATIQAIAPAAAMSAPFAQPHAPSTRTTLIAKIDKALRGSTATHARFQISGTSVGTVGRAPKRSSAPASNEKLLTTGTILALLGPQFRYATRVGSTAPITHGKLRGNLDLIGAGDPTLTTGDLAKMARHLRRLGLRHVTGRLVVDDTRYSHHTRARGWKPAFVPEESGPVSAFTVNHNDWRSGSAFDRDPTPDNARLWRKALKAVHITVAGATKVAPVPSMPVRLLTHHSSTLATIVEATLTYSLNFDAEMMLREIGAQRTGRGTIGTGIAGIQAEAATLDVPTGTIHDGSGLSYDDRQTPATIVAWLKALSRLPKVSTAVYDGLPVACRTGTLDHRLCGSATSGRVRAKTGTLDHVTALSGFATARSGRTLTFSFLLSGFSDRKFATAVSHLDKAVAVAVRNG